MRFVVRHGDAGDKRQWTGPDEDRPLSSTGQLEAEGLLVLLAGCPVDEILSSPAVRCSQTVQPLAEQRRLVVRMDTALSVDADLDHAVALVLDSGGDDLVLCTHGELIGPLLARLRELGAPLGDDPAWPKGSVWALEAVDGTITEATYLPPCKLDESR